MKLADEHEGVQEMVALGRRIGREVAAVHAADVDANARFPKETVDALPQLSGEFHLLGPARREQDDGGADDAERRARQIPAVGARALDQPQPTE